MNSFIVGVDISTTSTKVIIFDNYGKEISSGITKYDVIKLKQGFSEQRAEWWWDAFLNSWGEAIKGFEYDINAIKGISITHQRQSFAPIDKNGNVLRNAILWNDLRCIKEAEFAKEKLGELEIYKMTGFPATTWSIYKILWLKRNEPNIFSRIYKVLLAGDFVIFKLTGVIATSSGSASSMGCLNIKNPLEWSKKLLKELEIPINILPEKIFKGGEIIGYVKKELLNLLGIKKEIPIIAASGDQPCGSLGAGCIREGVVGISGGTSCCCEMFCDRAHINDKINYFIEISPIGGYLLENAIYSGLSALMVWFKNNFGQNFISESEELKKNIWEVIYNTSLKSSIGSGGIITIPYFTGAAAPFWDMKAKGIIFGLTEATKTEDIIRSILEGQAFETRFMMELMEEESNIKINEVRMYGGSSKSNVWNQIFADIVGIKTITTKTPETTALGAAICAAKGCNIYRSFIEAVKNMVKENKIYYPDSNNHIFYSEIYKKVYKNFYKLVRDKINILASISNKP